MKKRQKILELDYMRAIAAFGIFAIHATGGFVMYSDFNSNAMKLGMFINQFFRFGTPVFMMISGFVLFYNYRTPSEFSPAKFYKKKVTYLIIPYVIWSIGYFFFKRYIYNLPIEPHWQSILIQDILLGNTFSHLYFIFLIVQFYLIFPILIRTISVEMMEKPVKVFMLTALLQARLLIYEFYFMKQTNIAAINFINSFYWKTALGWFFYFITGGIIAYNYDKFVQFVTKNIKIIIPAYIGVLILFMGEVYLDVYKNSSVMNYEKYGSIRPMNMIYGILTFTILMYLTRKLIYKDNVILKLLKSFGDYSLGVYFAHPMILEYMKKQLLVNFPNHIGYGRVSSLIIIVCAGWILTMAFCYIVACFKARWVLIGKTPKLEIKRKKLKEV